MLKNLNRNISKYKKYTNAELFLDTEPLSPSTLGKDTPAPQPPPLSRDNNL